MPKPSTPQFGPGDVVRLDQAASVQFRNPIALRIIRVLDRSTYDGWVWLDGYQLNAAGEAVTRREIFAQKAGIKQLAWRKRPTDFYNPALTGR